MKEGMFVVNFILSAIALVACIAGMILQEWICVYIGFPTLILCILNSVALSEDD